ncbi:polymorphic toxin-type HINT domain-containing protein [Propionibacterium australiense]|uniref:Rhs_assc_core: RHS repeat-associated core domain n=1 Tax=Propionibacterium australiense TaxID=119981 RepID=A0A383S9H6_9ACTN|nr:polymorphic toxin-type HINT domain-containing protein [Propionibacterium australiense]RLP05885.1 hypothetical protein D9T14_13095 [Propionibacterium australiense]RLP05984.1 hypothetical protein D7U36_13330 [Propionibacterium australiense]SYZ34685.1 Rhs_assc_core: RHS repeat-associated core domain [Propionibacterium australiense]VEH88889.1 RHS repeat-associated core domain [Propionibacterium australiense]
MSRFGLGGGLGLSSTGTLGVDGLSLVGARVYDPATAGFLSTDPLPPVLGAGWAANPYSYAGNDPVNLSDPTGLRPLSDADLQGWKDQHKTGLAAAGDYLKENWKYLAGGALLTVVLTPVMGPVAAGVVAGGVISGWQNIDQQRAAGGPFDWGQFGLSVGIGAASGLIGGGVGAGVARSGLAQGMSCLGRSTFVGGVSGAAGGGFAGGAGYLAGPGPHTPTGLLAATGKGAAIGGGTGAAAGALSGVTETSAYGCFPAGTAVFMADGTSKPIEQVTEGDQVASVDPDTGQRTAATVTGTFTHQSVATLRLATDSGEVITTAAHPFYVEGKGFTPAGELVPGDVLRDQAGQPVELLAVEPTGITQTVHNIEIGNAHTYYVRCGVSWLLVHNECHWDSAAGRWRDADTGRFRSCPDTFSETVDKNGHVNFTDIDQIATQKNLPNEWKPSPNPNKFQDGGIKYKLGREIIHGHGKNIDAPPGSYAADNPTATISKGHNVYRQDGTWGKLKSDPAGGHLPFDNSPFSK